MAWKVTMRRLVGGLLLLTLGWLSAQSLQAQQGSGTIQQQRVFDVRRKQIALRDGRAEFVRTQELFNEGLASQATLERARASLEQLQVSYQEAILSLLSLQPQITIEKAVKYQDNQGRKFVRLTVANLTPAFDDRQFELLQDFEGAQPIPAELRTRDIRGIFVSLQDSGDDAIQRGTTIGLPYQQHIPELKYGARRTLVFQLLRDVASVVVSSSYMGQRSELSILLQQEDSGSALNISSTQLSQEADLGGQVTYALRLERSSVDVRSFNLEVLGLPRQISFSFVEPKTQARLAQLNFPAGVMVQSLELRLFLPEQADEQVVIDQPIEFWAVATDDAHRFDTLSAQPISREELERSGVGFSHLTLTPRGTGRIEVTAPSLFSEIEVGESVRSTLSIRNTGTRRLDDIWLRSEAPTGWKVAFTPERIAGLDLRKDTAAEMLVEPPADVAVGDYEIRISIESYAYNRRVPSETKVFRISIRPRLNILVTGGLVAAVALILGAGILVAIRVTRR